MEWLADPTAWLGLLTLVVLEIVLGIDNLIFIAILADKLPPHQRDKARMIGLFLAMLMRMVLLTSISWLVTLTAPLFSVLGQEFSGRDLILLTGGIFLLFKATMELHDRLEGAEEHQPDKVRYASFWTVVAQIVVLDAVFSIDAVITAVGMSDHLEVMMLAVIIAIGIMMIASKPLTRFVNQHPTVVILCLGFLLMIGFSLVAEGFGLHIPKGYLYAAIGFSVLIEVFNQVARFNRQRYLAAKRNLRDRTAEAVLRLLGGHGRAEHQGAAESVDMVATHGNAAQLFESSERAMIKGVLHLADRPIKALMTPRPDIVWLDLEDPVEEWQSTLSTHAYSRYLVARGQLDEVEGVIQGRDLLVRLLAGQSLDLQAVLRQPLFIHEDSSALKALEQLRQHPIPVAVVIDEYGSVEGLVTSSDILASIAGDLADNEDDEQPEVVRRDDGSLLLDAGLALEALEELLQRNLPHDGDFHTLAGLLLNQLGHLPHIGETCELYGYRFEIVAMDGRRIDRVSAMALAEEHIHH